MNRLIAPKNLSIILIMVLALGLRLLGLHHGYPYSYYPDESHFVKRALSFGSFDFNPHWFHKPAFYMYLLFFEYGVFFVLGKIAGLWASASDFAVLYVRNPGPFYMIGRVTTVLFSVGSVWLVYKIGERHFKPRVGLVAALFLSLSFGSVVASQDVKADTPTMFFTVASMLFLLNYVETKKKGTLLGAVVMAGMGTATKEYSVVMLAPIMLGITFVLFERDTDKRRLLPRFFAYGFMVLGVFLLVFFICSPYNFIDPLGRKSTMMAEVFFRLIGTPNEVKTVPLVKVERPDFFTSAIKYFALLPSKMGMGSIIALFSCLGLVFSMMRLDKKNLLLFIFPLIFSFISIIANPLRADTRHQLPLFPFLSVFGALFVVALADRGTRYRKAVFWGLAVLLMIPLFQIISHGNQISKPDTRNIAKAWIESNIPSGTKILLDENGPQLLINEARLNTEIKKATLEDNTGQFTAHYDTYLSYQLLAAKNMVAYDLSYIRFPWWRSSFEVEGSQELRSERDKDMGNPLRPVGVHRYEEYVAQGFQYVIVQSDKYEDFFGDSPRKAARFPAFARLYETLFDTAVLLKEFSPSAGDFSGPTVKVFKIGQQ